MRGKGSPEPQVPERGVEDKWLLDDCCMGIELTCNECFFDTVNDRRFMNRRSAGQSM